MTKQSTPHGDEQLKSLLDTLERLRKERFPQLDAELVRELMRLHAAGQTADAEIARNVEQAVERSLSKEA